MTTPEGFTTLFPYLFVDGAEEYIEFLTHGLGGREESRTLNAEGKVANCQIRFGDTPLMLAEALGRFPRSRVSLYLYVESADAAMARALAQGASLEMEAADMDYGDRQGGVKDAQGNIWWISERL